MFSLFWHGVQQDFKLFLLAPVLCAIFRLAFILVYRPKKTPAGEWRKWLTCFRYGFWWGMDVNAYVFLLSMLLVTVPGAFLPAYFAAGDTVRLVLGLLFSAVLYTAFMGKMIFWYYFHDTFNLELKLGGHADKKNLLDIFFHQNHGGWILLGYLPFLALCALAFGGILHTPVIPYWHVDSAAGQYALNTLAFILAIVLFYWIRYGGTLNHRKKPEWDDIPPLVKNDGFMGKATMDDLVALKLVRKQTVYGPLKHTDAESVEILHALPVFSSWTDAENPLERCRRQAAGARIPMPSHIFYLVGESHGQALFDAPYARLHLMEASERWRAEPHTFAIPNFLSAGMHSRPSLVSQILGIYDANLELNEMQRFWHGTVASSLPVQLRRLGYRSEYWYGGWLNHGSMNHFVPAAGFDAYHEGPEICPKGTPQTWLGVHDHFFLEAAAEMIREERADTPVFHMIYTTSHHGPYNLPYAEYGFDVERVMPDAPEAVKKDKGYLKPLASLWYTDQALMKFLSAMREAFPDSLFLVTGDHAANILRYPYDLVRRGEGSMRENLLDSFAISHPALEPSVFAGNTIGGHMNILPTIFELIAPAGFPYYSLFPSLLEPIDHVVTPYCWETRDTLGDYRDGTSQSLAVSEDMLPVAHGSVRFQKEHDALCELTGWMVRHPELLLPAKKE